MYVCMYSGKKPFGSLYCPLQSRSKATSFLEKKFFFFFWTPLPNETGTPALSSSPGFRLTFYFFCRETACLPLELLF